MNNYKFNIIGMHCNACTELIKMELEDNGLENNIINLNNNEGKIESTLSIEDIKEKLDKVFQNLEKYKYYNLQLLA